MELEAAAEEEEGEGEGEGEEAVKGMRGRCGRLLSLAGNSEGRPRGFPLPVKSTPLPDQNEPRALPFFVPSTVSDTPPKT